MIEDSYGNTELTKILIADDLMRQFQNGVFIIDKSDADQAIKHLSIRDDNLDVNSMQSFIDDTSKLPSTGRTLLKDKTLGANDINDGSSVILTNISPLGGLLNQNQIKVPRLPNALNQ